MPANDQGEHTGRHKLIAQAKPLWLPVLLALVVAMVPAIGALYVMGNRIDVNAQDIESNGEALASTPTVFIPRNELNVNLRYIELQVESVKTDVGELKTQVGELKDQSARQTDQILRELQQIQDGRLQ